MGIRKSDFSRDLTEYAGIKIYRDSVRVKPYGELDQPGGDWLNLGTRFAQNPAGRGRPSHRIRPRQLVGAIYIGRDSNPELSDSAAREGLIEDDSFRLLREIAIGCIRLVEARSHEIFTRDEDLQLQKSETVDRTLERVNRRLENVRDDLLVVSHSLSTHQDPEIKAIGENIAINVSKITFATESIEVIELQTRLYRALATVGIASVVFGHETQIQISRMVGAVNMIRDFLSQSPPDISMSISNIDIAIEASTKVSAWGEFALDRIRRDKRERKVQNISTPVLGIIKGIGRAFEAVDITIDQDDIDGPFSLGFS